MIKDEPVAHKKVIKRHACSLLIVSILFWAFYFARYDSTDKMQTRFNNAMKKAGLKKIDYSIYDANCLTGGKFPDDADAQEILDLRKEILDGCDNDKDCIEKGSRWSSIYLANGFVMFLTTCGAIMVLCGLNHAICRCCAAWLLSLVCITNFGVFITTAVWRFGPAGKLCAMNIAPTFQGNLKDETEDSWTYEKDGQLILALWILQVLGCCCCLFAGVNMPKPKGIMK